MIAATQERVESIVYWTRLGERLPQDGGQQRTARLLNAMEGYVADGALVRFSAVGDSEAAFRTIGEFIPAMLRSISRDALPAFVGTRLARSIA